MSVSEMIDTIDSYDGVDPITGVTMLLDSGAYAAYADLNSLGVDPDEFSDWRTDAEDAYQGDFESDEEFAQEMAEQLDLVDSDAQWPNNCIDWERAARELMYDYSKQGGYYFRD